MTPNPRPASRLVVLEDAAATRRLDCAHYGECLEHAVAEGWEGFACGAGCYQPLDDEQRARDLLGLLIVARLAEHMGH